MSSSPLGGLRPPAFYLVHYAAIASITPFLVLHYREQGVSGLRLGVLVAVAPLMSLVGAPLLAALGDALRRPRGMLVAALTTAIVASQVIRWSPAYLWLAGGVVLFSLAMSPVVPTVDAMVIEGLGAERHRYGRFRAWGSVGWAVTAPIAGWLTDRAGLRAAFVVFPLLTLVTITLVSGFDIEHASGEKVAWWRLGEFSGGRWREFLMVGFLAGLVTTVSMQYLFLYFDDLGATRGMIGIALMVSAVSEPLVMWGSRRLLSRWDSASLIGAALVTLAIRLVLNGLVGSPWGLVAVQILHGPSYALLWVGAVTKAGELAPEGRAGAAQGVMGAMLTGLGPAVGGVIGGVIYSAVGAPGLFRMAAIPALVAAVLAMRLATASGSS